MKRYVTWKEGVEPAAAQAKVTIGAAAVAAVAVFVAPQLAGGSTPAAEKMIVRIAEVIAKADQVMLEAEAVQTEADIAAEAELEAEMALHL
ncbi:hypothetical protein [Streptomyces mirabilis]|uniref:hypothetical protein n=1 Tax=Streptomyces mirabilis TaxID=68239 RepID=UPI0036A58EEC